MDPLTLSGQQLLEALRDKTILKPTHSITGIVKQSDKEGRIAFSISGCGHWIDLPAEMVKTAEHIGWSNCGDHSHPVMAIELYVSDTPESQVLIAIMSQQQAGQTQYEHKNRVQDLDVDTQQLTFHRVRRPLTTRASMPSNCHVTSFYKCSGAPNEPWRDAYGNGSTCLAAKQNATMAYNRLCQNAGLGTAVFDVGSIDCYCD